MPGIIEFPTIVQQAVEQFGALFANEPERRHFGEYLTGLLVAEKKNVSGINAEFAQTTDQSCLNRWITEVGWDVAELNRQRLAGLQQDPATRYAPSGIIPIDNTLVDHAGKLIEDVGYFWDHAEQRHKIAHDYLIVNYVCPSGKHYALEFRRFRKRDPFGGIKAGRIELWRQLLIFNDRYLLVVHHPFAVPKHAVDAPVYEHPEPGVLKPAPGLQVLGTRMICLLRRDARY